MNIVVLCGGLSQERDVSLLSGQLVAKALKKLGHKVVTIDLYFGYTGTYHDPRELFTEEHTLADLQISEDAPDLETVKKSRRQANNSLIGDNVIEVCRAADLTFLALHGAEGENGKLQGLFDLLDIRYTGCGSLASAIAMNKDLAKKVMAEAGVRVPGGITVHAGSPSYPLPSLPCVVKPKSGGSSIGTSLVFKEEEYLPALELGFRYEDTLLVEDYIKGLTGASLKEGYEARETHNIIVRTKMPEFKYDYQASLKDMLSNMGIREAFSDQADFSKMASQAARIDDVLHKTHIEVDKEGTKAAAVTAAVAKATAMPPMDQVIKEVYLDRPFVYAIIDQQTGIPLFLGALRSVK